MPSGINASTSILIGGISILIGGLSIGITLLALVWRASSVHNDVQEFLRMLDDEMSGFDFDGDRLSELVGRLREVTDQLRRFDEALRGSERFQELSDQYDLKEMADQLETILEDIEPDDFTDTVKDVRELNTDQINEILTELREELDPEELANVPGNINGIATELEDISGDIDEMLENTEPVEDVNRSVNNIEQSMVPVNFRVMQAQLNEIADLDDVWDFEETVTLDRTGTDVDVDLLSIGKETTEVRFRFEEDVQAPGILDLLEEDDDLRRFERELFGETSKLRSPSPAEIDIEVPNRDEELIRWMEYILDTIDDHHLEFSREREEFEQRLEELDR